jgi:AcrR family transcriptional regulator
MTGTGGRTAAGSPRERLLQAARDVLADDGLEGLTLRAIARRAGVSHGAPLRHFPSLGSLLAAVAADGFRRLFASVDAHVAAADRAAAATCTAIGPRHRLAAAGQGYLQFALDDPGVFSVTFRPERIDIADAAYLAEGMRAFGQLLDLVAAAQADGWHADQPTDALAGVVWANVHGVAVLILHGALPGVVDDVDRVPGLSALLTLGVDATDLLRPTPLPQGSTP